MTDALGQVTTLDYSNADPLLVTKVTDPFGRFATLTYDASGRLDSVTDMAGMTSRFSYDQANFMQAMITPYGTTTFRHSDSPATGFRQVEATDPEGGTERLEFHGTDTSSQSSSRASEEVPSGFSGMNQGLQLYNSLYWSKKAMADAPGDLGHAVVTHWLMASEMAYDPHPHTYTIPHSIKRLLETRIWYRYPDQGDTTYSMAGTGDSPSKIARLLEDGSTQLTQATYNTRGFLTATTDPAGRETTFTYASNGIDLLEGRQTKPGGNDLLASYADYNSHHQPETTTDAAGQTTTITYNVNAQPLTITNLKRPAKHKPRETKGARSVATVRRSEKTSAATTALTRAS